MESLLGPYHLSEKDIDNYVMNAVPGIFVTGTVKNHEFQPQWVGRADECVNYRLKERLGQFSHFKFTYTLTQEEAFMKQCRIHHDLLVSGKLHDATHPLPPVDASFRCPVCGS